MNRKNIHPAAGVACLFFLVVSLTVMQSSAFGDDRIPIRIPMVKEYSMPHVLFLHERHVEALSEAGKDCTSCHIENDEGMSEYFLEVDKYSVDDGVRYMHKSCTACHATMKRGPRLVECRLCHQENSTK